MNTVHSEKLYTLKEAAQTLGVSIETLLSWNHHNILKPTITADGQIAYTKSQIDHFQVIRMAMNQTPQMSTTYQQETTAAFQQFSQASYQPNKTSRGMTTQRIIVFSALTLFVLFGISLLPQGSSQKTLLTKEQNVKQLADKTVNEQTSKLTISNNSSVPIQLQENGQQDSKNVQNEGETVLQEQISAPTLYSDEKTAKTAQMQQESIDGTLQPLSEDTAKTLGIDTTALANTYAFSSGNTTETSDNGTSAIDAQGNIRKDTLATIMGSIDDVTRGTDLPTATTDTTTVLLFILLATGAGFYLFQNQLALLGRKMQPQQTPVNPFQPTAQTSVEKVMDIAHKLFPIYKKRYLSVSGS